VTQSDAPQLALLDGDHNARFDAALLAIEERESRRDASRAMWRTHHWPEQYDRCTIVAGRHVCRRCLTLYPMALGFAVLSLVGMVAWPAALDLWFIWLLCIPATIDFVFEQTQIWAYSARRQVITTALFAPALGRGFGHELSDSWSPEFWGPVLVFCSIWFLAALGGQRLRKSHAELESQAELESNAGVSADPTVEGEL